MTAFLFGHAAIAGGGRCACSGCAPAKGFLGGAGKRAETHSGNGDRDIKLDRLFGKPCAERHPGVAFFPVSLERIA